MLDGNSLVEFLKERGFSTLCHVNTTATALTFLRNGGLLSRQYVEEHPETCFQTIQKSDAKDKEFGIFRGCPAYILLYQFSPKDTGQSKVK